MRARPVPLRLSVGGQALVVVVLVTLPLWLSSYQLDFARDVIILGTFALSLDLLWGRAGLLSFGQAAFFGLGAYAIGVTRLRLQWPSYLGLVSALLVPAAMALVLGYFLLVGRVRGATFSIVTLALSLFLMKLAVSWADVTGGDTGLLGVPPLSVMLGGVDLAADTPISLYYVAAACAGGAYLLVRLLLASRFGLILSAIRDDEERAAFLGYNTPLYLLTALVISAAVAGVSGAVYATSTSFVAYDLIGPGLSTLAVVWVAVGGRGTLIGAFVGAFVAKALEATVSSYLPGSWPFFLGVFFLLMVFVSRNGIVHLLGALLSRLILVLPTRQSASEGTYGQR